MKLENSFSEIAMTTRRSGMNDIPNDTKTSGVQIIYNDNSKIKCAYKMANAKTGEQSFQNFPIYQSTYLSLF